VATFLPCYFFTVIFSPYFKKFGKVPGVAAFVDGVTEAAIGTIAGAVVVLGQRSEIDIPTALLAVGTVILLLKIRKLPEPVIVAGAAVFGLLIYTIPKL
jgi:chromate transporter